jgi:BMFP domain-containing protein YqiC
MFVIDIQKTSDSGEDKRRSARLLHAVPIIVTGTDALGQSFKETTTTVMVSCTGCKYKSTHYVPKNSTLTVEINRTIPPKSRRIMRARVVWVQRPSNYRDLFHIAVEFDVPGNVWGITAPPENWFPHPEDIELEIPVTEPVNLESAKPHASAVPQPAPYSGSFTASVETIERPDANLPRAGSQPHMTAVATLVAEPPKVASNGEKSVIAMPAKEAPGASQYLEAKVQHAVKEVLARELETFRSELDAHVREAIAGAIRNSMEHEASAAIEKILNQSTTSISAIVEQAQKTIQESAERLDEKFRLAAAAAVNSMDVDAANSPRPRTSRKGSKRKLKPEVVPES